MAKRSDASSLPWVPNGSDDPSYEEHGILGALKLRVGGLFGTAAAPAAIDSSYDQFNAASLLSQEGAVEEPPVVSPTQPQLASEPDSSPTGASAPVQSEQTSTPPVGSPAAAAAAAAASSDEAAAVAAADASAQEDATVRAPSPLLASPRLAGANPPSPQASTPRVSEVEDLGRNR